MAVPTPSEYQKILYDLLSRDSTSGYYQLTYYLKSILGNHPLSLDVPGKGIVDIPADEAWILIEKWALDTEANLPMGDRGSRTKRASRLLNYLELTVQGKAREAAAAHQAILESVRTKPLNSTPTLPSSPNSVNLKKLLELRNTQYQLLQDKYLGKLETAIQQTAYLKRFKNDPYTYSLLSGLLAANSVNLINQPTSAAVADEIARLTQYHAGNGAINNAAHLAYATELQQKGGELDQLVRTIQDITDSVYGDNEKGRIAYHRDMEKLTSLTHITSLSQIPELIAYLAPDASVSERNKLSQILRSTIVATLDEGYADPKEILNRAANTAGVPDNQLSRLQDLTPLIAEIRYNELHNTTTGNLLEHSPRIHATLNLATDIGVSAHIPWLSDQDLDARAVLLIQKYNLKEGESFKQIIEAELGKGDDANFVLISELSKQLSDQAQYRDYRRNVSSNIVYYFREKFGLASGTVRSFTQPAERFYERTNTRIYGAYSLFNSPFDSIGDWVLNIQDEHPILNLPKYINDKVMGAQLWVAKHILDWSDQIKGTGRWYSSVFGHISDFSSGFIHSDGQWNEAAFHFVQTKWGNVLDWGAKKAGYAGFQAVKAQVGTSLWNGFAKMAPGLAAKLNSGAMAKVVSSLMLGELTAGTSLLIQAGLMVVGAGVKKIWQLLTSAAAREEFFNKLPIYALTGSLVGGIVALPGLLLGGLITIGGALMSGLAFAASSLMSLFIPAMIVAGISLASFFLIHQSLNFTARLDVNLSLDSGVGGIIGNILCDSEEGGNAKAKTAACIVEILSKCGINPLTASNAGGSSWQCVLASTLAQSAIAELQRSATSYSVLQCVGFIVAVDAATGGAGSGFGNANSLLSSPPSGYRAVLGVGSCSPGDFFVDVSGAWGHTGVFLGNAGAVIKCMDANGGGPGLVRGSDSCVWPSSKVAGCLKKN